MLYFQPNTGAAISGYVHSCYFWCGVATGFTATNSNAEVAQYTVKVLSDSIRNLWKTTKYHQEYISYLIGSITREDLESRLLALPNLSKPLNDKEIAAYSAILLEILEEPLTSADLANFIGVEVYEVEEALSKYKFIPTNDGDSPDA